jgi:hypothetical protein
MTSDFLLSPNGKKILVEQSQLFSNEPIKLWLGEITSDGVINLNELSLQQSLTLVVWADNSKLYYLTRQDNRTSLNSYDLLEQTSNELLNSQQEPALNDARQLLLTIDGSFYVLSGNDLILLNITH